MWVAWYILQRASGARCKTTTSTMYERQEVHLVLPSRSSPSSRSFSSRPPPLPHHWVSHQHQRENGQRGRQACSSSAEPQPKKKELESEEDQKRKGHIPEPERGPQHHQEHQAEEAGGHQLHHARVAGVNKKQENSFFFPKQKFRSPCISRSNFAPTPLIFQFLLVFKQQLFEVTKKHRKKNKKMCQKWPFLLNSSLI